MAAFENIGVLPARLLRSSAATQSDGTHCPLPLRRVVAVTRYGGESNGDASRRNPETVWLTATLGPAEVSFGYMGP